MRDLEKSDSDQEEYPSCTTCNGYYGPSFGEPVCPTCHAFLYADDHEHPEGSRRELGSDVGGCGGEDRDSGNEDEPSEDYGPMNGRNTRDNNHSLAINVVAAVRAVEPLRVDLGDGGPLDELPSEVLILIFSYLDDISLYAVGNVSHRWNSLLLSHTSSRQWHSFTQSRWPLFTPLAAITDWYSLYAALIQSSYCLTCIYSMRELIPADVNSLPLRWKRLGHDLRNFTSDPLEGIRAIPLDSSYYHWQASITGPVGSPYEGGMFFLYLKVPFTYPFDPPKVRFLSRIFHPNISRHGDVGIDLIQENNWSSSLTIPKVLISIQSLLTDPYCEICMEPRIGSLYRKDRKKFDEMARLWTWKYAIHDAIPPQKNMLIY
eukprot:TRINITY_DN11490_c0_g1_i1.p1 TRINITY_DN11490_c0_g1~~TRINITY_DN11490_c0_g1_i1.p1  ORF type:complete len:375 (-),score=79.25 TRINITY_DN11490_c0_g1_i1:56-1180(-)